MTIGAVREFRKGRCLEAAPGVREHAQRRREPEQDAGDRRRLRVIEPAVVVGVVGGHVPVRGSECDRVAPRADVQVPALGQLPRVKASTKNEGHERRYFYGSVWAVTIAQPVLWFLWKALPRSTPSDIFKLVVFVGILALVGNLARLGLLPRTRPIVPGELAVSD